MLRITEKPFVISYDNFLVLGVQASQAVAAKDAAHCLQHLTWDVIIHDTLQLWSKQVGKGWTNQVCSKGALMTSQCK